MSTKRHGNWLSLSMMLIPLLTISLAFAQDSRPISFQGHLTDDTGAPANGNFDLNFGLFESPTALEPVWSETLPAVQVAAGNFTVRLGSLVPIPLSVLQLPDLYLGITVVGDEMMSPKIPFSDVPRVSISRRLDGDIITEQSAIRIHPPEPGLQNGVEIGAVNDSNYLNLYPIHPPEPGMSPAVAVNSTPDNGASLLMFNPQPEPPAIGDPWIAMNTGLTTGASLVMFNPQPEPPALPMLSMNTLTSGSSFEMTSPQFQGAGLSLARPIWQMTADNSGGKLNLYNPVIGADVPPVVAINSSVGGDAGMYMFNPQPEPPADGNPWIAMTTGITTGASLVMFNPQPEPPAEPFLELNTNMNGASFTMAAPQALGGRLQMDEPMMEVTTSADGINFNLIKAFMSPTGGMERVGFKFSADSLSADLVAFGPGNEFNPTFILASEPGQTLIGLGTAPTNVITVALDSPTDPIAHAWTTYSSRRWKTDIETLDNSLAKVMSLRGVSYKWKESGKRDIGLIAEEVGLVVPEIVEYEENGIDARSVDYTRIVPLLIEATKEQQKTIDQLRNEVAELKAIVNGMVSKEGDSKASYTSAQK